MREIAHMSDSAIDHIGALLAILLSLQLDPGSWGRRGSNLLFLTTLLLVDLTALV